MKLIPRWLLVGLTKPRQARRQQEFEPRSTTIKSSTLYTRHTPLFCPCQESSSQFSPFVSNILHHKCPCRPHTASQHMERRDGFRYNVKKGGRAGGGGAAAPGARGGRRGAARDP